MQQYSIKFKIESEVVKFREVTVVKLLLENGGGRGGSCPESFESFYLEYGSVSHSGSWFNDI